VRLAWYYPDDERCARRLARFLPLSSHRFDSGVPKAYNRPQRIAVDAVVALTDWDREQATAFIRSLYLGGVKDPKRLTFKGLQALARG
jgi:hypothetical protein